jgi:hypothetical protein
VVSYQGEGGQMQIRREPLKPIPVELETIIREMA